MLLDFHFNDDFLVSPQVLTGKFQRPAMLSDCFHDNLRLSASPHRQIAAHGHAVGLLPWLPCLSGVPHKQIPANSHLVGLLPWRLPCLSAGPHRQISAHSHAVGLLPWRPPCPSAGPHRQFAARSPVRWRPIVKRSLEKRPKRESWDL